MAIPSEYSPRLELFRSSIAAFIDQRRDDKLRGKEPDAEMASRYDYGSWLADAARRVSQIQAVTHVLKATHPDARGTSLHVVPSTLPPHAEIGTHSLGADFVVDIVGNAAALDVYKFLKIEVEGRRLLDWMQASDPDLQAALHEDSAVAAGWVDAFKGLVHSDAPLASHGMAKQLYWLTGDSPAEDSHYHLLQPLFSSSLAHAVHTEIQEARFGEANTQVRHAFRAKEAHSSVYRDYRNLVARKLGGTKPHNVSQRNSERGGVNYLLSSLPPRWTRGSLPSLLNTDSAFERFAYFEGVQELLRALCDFLRSDPDKNVGTRMTREAIEQALGRQLPLFAASIQAVFEPGWTRNGDCCLPRCEQLWLDPERRELPERVGHEQEDRDFIVGYEKGDWPNEVAGRFANWINERLHDAGVTAVGDAEYRHWARQAILDADWPVPIQRAAGDGK